MAAKSILEEVSAKWLECKPAADGGIDPITFLAASSSITKILDLLTGMGIVKSDMEGNIGKILANLSKAPPGASLQQMVDAEITGGGVKAADAAAGGEYDASTACALTWLKRALRLIEGMLRSFLEDKQKPLPTCASEGYDFGLKAYHGYVTYGVVTTALSLAPTRETFIEALGGGEASIYANLEKTIPHFSALTKAVHEFLVSRKIETVPQASSGWFS
jgi:hypothetical protein